MDENNRPDLKQRTKEWLNRYGKYIFIAVALLSFLAVAFSIKSFCAPVGSINGFGAGANSSSISNVIVVYQDGTFVAIPFDDLTYEVQSNIYVNDETQQIGVYTEYYEAEPSFPGDFTYYGTYLTCPSAYPTGVSYFSMSTRQYVTHCDTDFVYQPFDYIYVGNDQTLASYNEYCTIRYYVEYYDANATVFADEIIENNDYILGEAVPPLTYTDLNPPETSQPLYLGVTMSFACDVPLSMSVPTPTNFDITEINFYESVPLTRVEQPVYTDLNPVTIITSAIDSLFDVEWIGGISFGVFFGLIIAIPVVFFVFKAFLGG